MDLLALVDFTLVARHGGFGRAARATGRPKATLSRRVADLEASLGLRLFERGSRDVKLTEEGRALFVRAGSLLTELDETAAAIASGGARPRGRMRVSAPLLFSQVAMGRLAAGFALAYPEVRLEVTTEDRTVDMVEEGIDLVIRVNPDPDESLVGRPFLHDRLVVVADPGLARPAQGRAVPAVLRGSRDAAAWRVRTAPGPAAPQDPGLRSDRGEGGVAVLAIAPVLALSSLVMVRDAVRAGVGAASLPLSLVGQDIARGRLALWGEVDAPDIALWALYPTRRLLSARVSAFLDHLKQAFPDGTPEELARFAAD